MKPEEKIKLFKLSRDSIEKELENVEKKHNIKIFPQNEIEEDRIFYPQFEEKIRDEAKKMARFYELYYCLERSIRDIIIDIMKYNYGEDWWEKDGIIPEEIKDEANKNMKREMESAMTPRSDEKIDYTTFGQLSEIVKKNWDDFSDLFNNKLGFVRVMNALNNLRGPIAHCSMLPDSEIRRLELTVEDWFRLMS